jgi:hypothetical protein
MYRVVAGNAFFANINAGFGASREVRKLYPVVDDADACAGNHGLRESEQVLSVR